MAVYNEQQNAELEDKDVAMDFFSGLDNGRYADFKATFLNGLTVKSITPPEDLNAMYSMISQWVKPKAMGGGGTASTFATTLDEVEKPKRNNGKTKSEKDGKIKKGQDAKYSEDAKKEKRIECFKCGGNHYINKCPELQKNKAKEEDDERVAAATFEACTFATYQVNAIGYKGFKNTEVLLDNQANTSIMKPDLLRAFGKVEEEIKISGVGGVQLSTNTTGYLEDFFRVFVSSETKANVLSFAEVENNMLWAF